MVLLARDCMDQSAAILNDTAKTLYTYVAQLPYLKIANDNLDLILIANGFSVQRRTTSTAIQVPSSTGNITLNLAVLTDMFLPIKLLERASGSSDVFVPLDERDWEPEIKAVSSLGLWVFRDNNIYFPPVTSAREVKVDYWRQLSTIIDSTSVEEVTLAKTYLSARCAELCARFVGENTEKADSIRDNEVSQAQENLERVYNKNSQGVRSRRRRFTRTRSTYSR